jgi:hypothetical protein
MKPLIAIDGSDCGDAVVDGVAAASRNSNEHKSMNLHSTL